MSKWRWATRCVGPCGVRYLRTVKPVRLVERAKGEEDQAAIAEGYGQCWVTPAGSKGERRRQAASEIRKRLGRDLRPGQVVCLRKPERKESERGE